MYSRTLTSAIFVMAILSLGKVASAENIDPYDSNSQYAYGENVGWLNFEPNITDPNAGAMVTSAKLTGFIWAENIGWINLSPVSYGGVVNDGSGNLSGYSWSENAGWISFSCENTDSCGTVDYGVTIDAEGNFDGWAWGENIGWINFQSADLYGYNIKACMVNFEDLGNFVDDWLKSGQGWPADLADNNDVDFVDYSIFAEHWLDFCPESWPLKIGG